MIKRMVITSAIFTIVVVTPVSYMLADNQPPYEYDAANSYVVPDHTPSGRQLLIHWKFKHINRVCPGVITRWIVDQATGVRVSYDPTPAAKNIELEDSVLERTFYLPPGITSGKKWYYSDAEFACNPLQHFYPLRVRTPRLSFEVD